MATLEFPAIPADKIKSLNSGDFFPYKIDFLNGDEFISESQGTPSGLELNLEYNNLTGTEITPFFEFCGEARGGKEFNLPKEVWKHNNYMYLGLTSNYPWNKFVLQGEISIRTQQKNIYNVSIPLVTILSTDISTLLLKDFQNQYRITAIIFDADYNIASSQTNVVTHTNPLRTISLKYRVDGANYITEVISFDIFDPDNYNVVLTYISTNGFYPLVELNQID